MYHRVIEDFVGYVSSGDEGSSRGANTGRCGAVCNNGGYGAVENSLFDYLFDGGDVVDVIDDFLRFNLAGGWGCVI